MRLLPCFLSRRCGAGLFAGGLLLTLVSSVRAFDPYSSGATWPGSVQTAQIGGSLDNTASSDWWYGCAPTSVGMLLGYYDRNGYNGYAYDNLIPGGVAEVGVSGQWSADSAILRRAIASEGHQRDFYNAATYGYNTGGGIGYGFGESGDDLSTNRSFDCIADFMLTSQDSVGHPNGGTTFAWDMGGLVYPVDAIREYRGQSPSGLCGIEDYIEWTGYSVASLYTESIDSYVAANGHSGGFTLLDYEAEIDAGRPVLLGLNGHMVLGVGYDEGTDLIEIYDTWDTETHTMEWGGIYSPDEYEMVFASVLELAPPNVSVPEAGASALLFGLVGMLWTGARRRCASNRG
ncbi:MAG: hypothetical protein E1N59_2960 [Puniceicoccaceae bacterium 5H]|nr:MAG: hypothetical protein E1N59_2960 [Puniceicoccaceae bacterium 5H]